MIEFFIINGPLIQVIAILVGALALASFIVWCVVGLVLWFVPGTHDTKAEQESTEWFDE